MIHENPSCLSILLSRKFSDTPICEELASKGNEVTVLTGLPNYPIGIVQMNIKRKRDEYINNVHVIRCYEVGRKSGIFYLALNYLSFYISASHHILKQNEKFDLVFNITNYLQF